MSKLQELRTTTRITYPLKATVSLHGMTADIDASVNVTRISDKSVSVATAKPIIVKAETFGLLGGLAKLSEAVNNIPIVTAASITFDLVFETGDRLPAIVAARQEAVKVKQQEETSAISAEACETRMSVISTTGAIYFKTGSPNWTRPASRCSTASPTSPTVALPVKIEVNGHTNSVGSAGANKQLSEQRAHSVVAYLGQHGVATQRVTAAGFGDTQPIAPNDSEANRAKNRRIEFRVVAH